MRHVVAAASLISLLAGGAPALAQQINPQDPFQSPVVTIDQQALFENSAFGKASRARLEVATKELQAENRKIEAALEAEERQLTDLRATMPAAEFRPLADAFDQKVEAIRAARDAKSSSLARQLDADQQRFFKFAVPILAEIMRDMGAIALLDQAAIVLSLDRVDITQRAIARIDQLDIPATDENPGATPDPAPVPDPAPDAPASAPDMQSPVPAGPTLP